MARDVNPRSEFWRKRHRVQATASCHSNRLKKWPLGHSTNRCNTKRCSHRAKRRSRWREVAAQYSWLSASLNIEAAVQECYQCFTPQRFKLSGELTNRRSQCEEMNCVPQTILMIFLTASESSECCAVSGFPQCPPPQKKNNTATLYPRCHRSVPFLPTLARTGLWTKWKDLEISHEK